MRNLLAFMVVLIALVGMVQATDVVISTDRPIEINGEVVPSGSYTFATMGDTLILAEFTNAGEDVVLTKPIYYQTYNLNGKSVPIFGYDLQYYENGTAYQGTTPVFVMGNMPSDADLVAYGKSIGDWTLAVGKLDLAGTNPNGVAYNTGFYPNVPYQLYLKSIGAYDGPITERPW